MKKQLTLIAVATTILAIPFVSSLVTTGKNSSAAYATPQSVGCGITVRGTNTSDKIIRIDLEGSDVRTKPALIATPWTKLSNRCNKTFIELPANSGQRSFSCELDLPCNIKRQYRFKIKMFTNQSGRLVESQSGWAYFPKDNDDWTTNPTIELGNLNQYLH